MVVSCALNTRNAARRVRRHSRPQSRLAAQLESLESRVLLTGLPNITITPPTITYGGGDVLNTWNASYSEFSLDLNNDPIPNNLSMTGADSTNIGTPSGLILSISLTSNGSLRTFSGLSYPGQNDGSVLGATGLPDLIVFGTLPSDPGNPGAILLSGNIQSFQFQDNPGNSDDIFQFTFTPYLSSDTSDPLVGELNAQVGTIGMTMIGTPVTGLSPFNGSFATGFGEAVEGIMGGTGVGSGPPTNQPLLVTTPTPTNLTLNASVPPVLTDSATITNGSSATGSILFSLVGPNSSVPIDTETIAVTGNGTYTTPTGYTLPAGNITGTYQWNAIYSGDANNLPALDINNPNESLGISPASPSIVTTPNITALTLPLTQTLTDTAVISGGYAPTGSITFTLMNGTATVDTETVTVTSNGHYTTPAGYTLPASAAAAGTYQWNAVFTSGDTNNISTAELNSPSESVTVSPAQPVLSTVAGATFVIGSGGVLTDTATLSGGYNPTGTLTFTLYNSSGSAVHSESVSIIGNGSYTTPTGYVPTIADTYQWVVQYSGDGSDLSALSSFGSEPETVSPASPSITTTPSPAVLTLSTGLVTLKDTATLTGGYSESGSITFTLVAPGGATVDTETVAVNGNDSYTTPTGYTLSTNATVTGTYQWNATFTATDGNNNNASDISDKTEQVTVHPAGPAITTTPNITSVALSTGAVTLKDGAVLSGGYNPQGTITFTLIAPGGATIDSETVTVNGNGPYATPAGYTLPANVKVTGTYQWNAVFTATDGNNSPASETNDPTEQVKVSPAGPVITTTPNITSAVLATTALTLKDSAVLSGGYSPTGSVTFTLVAPGGATVDTETVSITGNGTYSTPAGYTLPTNATVTGTYQWNATFTATDGNNSNASDISDKAEQVSVCPAGPSITTTPTVTALTLPATQVLKDAATLSGGYFPVGTITFTLVAPGGATVDTETVAVNGNGAYSTPTGYMLLNNITVAGTYQWNATFTSTNGNNLNAGDVNDLAERVTVSPASPSITTTPNFTAVTLATTAVILKDSAVLAGGYTPHGSITFTLIAPGGSTVDTETVGVTGNGAYSTPAGYTLPTNVTVTGTYQWNAVFTSTDGNNNNASDISDKAEQLTVSPATPSIITTPNATSVTLSTTSVTLKDSAVLSGGYTPAGAITFTLVAPGGSTVDTETVTVTGNGTYSTPNGYTLPANATVTGTYQWNATFTSTNGNNTTAGDINDIKERTSVSPASPCITTVPSATALTLSTTAPTLKDTATLTSGYSESGSITFTLIAPGGATVDTETVSVNGNGSYTTPTGYKLPTTATVTGTYQWNAVFTSTNGNNNAASDLNDAAERICISPASPGLTTTPGGTITIGSGAKLTDSANLSGTYFPTGTITFQLYSPSNTIVDTETVSVSTTTTTYTTPNGYLPSAAGTYQWVVTYSGNGNNISVTSPKGSEPECVIPAPPPPVTITGTKFLDATGNGFSCDDTGLAGVTIDLYKESGGGSGLQTASDTLVASTITTSNGTYSFTNLPGGYTYYVTEAVPAGDVQTGGGPNGSAGSTYYTINATAGSTYSNENFDDWQVGTCTPTCVSFKVGGNCTTKTVSDLRGNTVQGATVTVTFTVTMPETLTLVSYTAPGPAFDSTTAYQQQIFDEATGTYTKNGTYTLTVQIPNCYYQIDFVCGPAINELGPPSPYGPDGSNIFYSAENRLISADNGGTQACSMPGVKAGDFGLCSFWTSKNGQSLLCQLNGGGTSGNCTQLGCWLASNFPHLYGCQCDASNPYEKNLNNCTNAQICSFFNTLCNAPASCAAYSQMLACALGCYATDPTLAGGAYSHSFGLNNPVNGTGYDCYNVGTCGTVFGCANNSSQMVYKILACADQLGVSTASLNANLPSLNTLFGNINKGGNVTNADLSDQTLAYSPEQVRDAYGISNLGLDGAGQTIAIVGAYDTPTLFQALNAYDAQFGLTSSGPSLLNQYGDASSFLTVLNQSGGSDVMPDVDPTGNWQLESELDVEWAHAMAPGAHIVMVEANSQSLDDLMSAVSTAAALPGVSVVSMSWGMPEGLAVSASDEALYNNYLTTPAGHQGVTFVASTGDYGSADPEFPAFSPNVVAVGGTSLQLNSDNSYNAETGWGGYSDQFGSFIGSGGGTSMYEGEPAYQSAAQSTGYRSTPDVSLVADPNTGVWVADPYNLNSDNPWEVVGGTSLAAPAWAGIMALVNQGRANAGEQTLNSATPTDAQQALYNLPSSDFNQILTGNNGGFNAGAGYNMVTGLGTPVAGALVNDLVKFQPTGNNTGNEPRIIDNGDSTIDSADTFQATNAFAVSNVIVVHEGSTAGQAHADASASLYSMNKAAATSSDVLATAGSADVTPLVTDSGARITFSALSTSVPSQPSAPVNQASSKGVMSMVVSQAAVGNYASAGSAAYQTFAAVLPLGNAAANFDVVGAVSTGSPVAALAEQDLDEMASDQVTAPVGVDSAAQSVESATESRVQPAAASSGTPNRAAWLVSALLSAFAFIPFSARRKQAGGTLNSHDHR